MNAGELHRVTGNSRRLKFHRRVLLSANETEETKQSLALVGIILLSQLEKTTNIGQLLFATRPGSQQNFVMRIRQCRFQAL